MNAFLVPAILCFTVLASVSLGVLFAYVAVLTILHSFGRSQQPQPVAVARPRLVLVPTQHHASGD